MNQAIRIYANEDDNDAFPLSLAMAVDAMNRGNYRELQCPLEGAKNSGVTGYYYVLGLHDDDPPHWPVIFDDPMNRHQDDQLTVAFHDCSVHWLSQAEFLEVLECFWDEYEASRGHPPAFEHPDTVVPTPD